MLALIGVAHGRVTIGEAGVSDELHQLGGTEQREVDADLALEPVVDMGFALAAVNGENQLTTGSQHPTHLAQGLRYLSALNMDQRVEAGKGRARVVGKRQCP